MRGLLLTLLVACSFRHGAGPSEGGPGDVITPRDGPRDTPADVRRDGPPDSPVDLCLANQAACLGANGLCIAGTCVIAVTTTGGHPMCPSGMPCAIECTANSACSNAFVDCGQATNCTIDCVSNSTCVSSTLQCNPQTCTIYCRGTMSCGNGSIAVGGSTTCTVDCCGSQTCPGDFTIPATCSVGTTCPP